MGSTQFWKRIEKSLPVLPSPALKIRTSDECAVPYLALLNFDTLFLALSVLAPSTIIGRDLCSIISQLQKNYAIFFKKSEATPQHEVYFGKHLVW